MPWVTLSAADGRVRQRCVRVVLTVEDCELLFGAFLCFTIVICAPHGARRFVPSPVQSGRWVTLPVPNSVQVYPWPCGATRL